MDQLLSIRVTPSPAGLVVTVGGELDVAGAPRLTACLGEHAHHPGPIVLDLAAVTFLDSTGLRILLAAREHAQATGRTLTLIPSEAVRRVVRMAGLEPRLLDGPARDPRGAPPREDDEPALTVVREHSATRHTVRLRGRLVAASLPVAHAALDAALESGSAQVHLVLAGVRELDARALRFVAEAHLRCLAAGRRLIVTPPGGRAGQLLGASPMFGALHVEP